jgi:hypothetical protein
VPALRAIDDRVERHTLVTRATIAEQPDGCCEEFRVRIAYRTEADGMLSPAWLRRRRRRRVASHEVGDVRIPAQDDAGRREVPELVQPVFHHGVAVGNFDQPPRKSVEIVRSRRVNDAGYVAVC